MSDFIFTVRRTNPGLLSRHIQNIYHVDPPKVAEFHGRWGSLAVSRNIHMGFDPMETERYLCIVIGAPVLTFTSNRFLGDEDRIYGTRKLMMKWISGEELRWDDDVSGPFVLLKLDKKELQVELITDLMSFIPVYQSDCCFRKVIGTHVDVVARVAECEERRDPVSIADFILNGVVTYPFTLYSGVKQVSPASRHRWIFDEACRHQEKSYWIPREDNSYRDLDDAADDLRIGLHSYINAVTDGMEEVALFLSGGEDSRTILGMLPHKLERHAFVILEHMNREGRIAHAAARAYGARFTMLPREELWYFKVLKACSDLVGSGAQYRHVHSYGFHKLANLRSYRAVFGGFLSDTFLKLYFQWRVPCLGYAQVHAGPMSGANKCMTSQEGGLLRKCIFEALRARIDAHLSSVRLIRSEQSAQEWFNIWPISMQSDIAHLHGNRRLFASYEPFTANAVVKVSAAVPRIWKMRRRLFHKFAQPLLTQSKYLTHSNGSMPYYPWYINTLVRRVVSFWRDVQFRRGLVKGEQGPWSDLKIILESPEWMRATKSVIETGNSQQEIFCAEVSELFTGPHLDVYQKLNLMQVAYHCRQAGGSL